MQAVQADYDTRSPRWAHVYEGASFHDVVLQERMVIALNMLGRRSVTPGVAVDVGCGAGQLLEALHLEGAPVVGVDVSWQQVMLTRARVPATVFVAQADGEQLPFGDATVATLTALGLLEYLPSLHDGLTEFARVTMRGAYVVVSVPNPLRLAYLCDPIGVVLGRLRKARPGYRRTYRSARALAAELQACGFEVIELRGHGLGRFTFAGRPISRRCEIGAAVGVTPGAASGRCVAVVGCEPRRDRASRMMRRVLTSAASRRLGRGAQRLSPSARNAINALRGIEQPRLVVLPPGSWVLCIAPHPDDEWSPLPATCVVDVTAEFQLQNKGFGVL